MRGRIPPPLTDVQQLNLAVSAMGRELDNINNYFKTVNSCFLALAKHIKMTPKQVAELLADPRTVVNFETKVVEELRAISAEKVDAIKGLSKN